MTRAKLDATTLRWVARRLRYSAKLRIDYVKQFADGDSYKRIEMHAAGGLIGMARDIEHYLRLATKRKRRQKWSREDLLSTIKSSVSQLAVARVLKGSAGAIRKRCMRDAELKRAWLKLGRRKR